MKKIMVLWVGVVLLLAGCNHADQKVEGSKAVENRVATKSAVSQSSETEKDQQIYIEKKINLGLGEESTIQLVADEDAVSGKKLLINGTVVDLTAKSELQDEGCNHVKLLTNDFDQDGVQEILVLFYGGAGGSFQQFCMLKYQNKDWNIVDEDFTPLDSSFVKIKKQTNSTLKLEVTNASFEKKIDLPKNTNIKDESDIHIECRLFQLSGTKIILGLRLLDQSDDGNVLGDIRQEIRFDPASQKLELTKTKYLSKDQLKGEEYEQ